MLCQPTNVSGVAASRLRDNPLRKMIERLLEKSPIFIPATHHVAEPEHQKQVAVDPAAFRIAEVCSVRGAIPRGERALLAEGAGCRKALAGCGHSFEQRALFRSRWLFGEHIEQLQLQFAGDFVVQTAARG